MFGMSDRNVERLPAGAALHLMSKALVICAALMLAAVVCAAQGQSDQDQPLTKVAREKSARKAKVVITDDDLPSRAEPTVETSASSQTDSPAAEKAEKDDSAQPAKQSAAASGPKQPATVDETRALVEQLKQQLQVLTRRYDEMQRKASETDNESLRRMYSESLANRDRTLAQKQKQIDEAERALRLAEAGPTQGGTTNAAK
jgi:hypothetical protein